MRYTDGLETKSFECILVHLSKDFSRRSGTDLSCCLFNSPLLVVPYIFTELTLKPFLDPYLVYPLVLVGWELILRLNVCSVSINIKVHEKMLVII